MATAVTKKQVCGVVSIIILTVTTLMGAMAWVSSEISVHSETPHAASVSHKEFQLWVETQVRYNDRVLDQLQSLEEAIRGR